jgi:tetratricopeptide (TPR) repeat protein
MLRRKKEVVSMAQVGVFIRLGMRGLPWLLVLFAVGALLGGCSPARLAEPLSRGILQHPDPETVLAGGPAYLLLIDGMIERNPKDAELLRAGANLYALYTGLFVDDPQRIKRLAGRARSYGEQALCLRRAGLCGLAEGTYQEFTEALPLLRRRDVPSLHAFAIGWLLWLQAHSDDWEALADLPKVEMLLDRLVALDEGYEGGSSHFFLGILRSLRSPALGGDPEQGRYHFERALELSGGRDLSIKVEFARHYARMVYDRELHDQLLREVLAADAAAPGFTLRNTIAQRQARRLLISADEHF